MDRSPRDRCAGPALAALALAAFFALPHHASAGEIDLAAAGCPDLPDAGRFMTIQVFIEPEGGVRDCDITDNPRQFCQQYHTFDEGFLCLGLTHNPRPDITAAETTASLRVDRLIVDGEEIVDDWDKTVLRRDLATGPSGDTYDIRVEHGFGARTYSLVVNVTATPDGPVRFNSVSLAHTD